MPSLVKTTSAVLALCSTSFGDVVSLSDVWTDFFGGGEGGEEERYNADEPEIARVGPRKKERRKPSSRTSTEVTYGDIDNDLLVPGTCSVNDPNCKRDQEFGGKLGVFFLLSFSSYFSICFFVSQKSRISSYGPPV